MKIHFYHPAKKINYLNTDACVFIQLNSLNQQSISKEEQEKIEYMRVDKNKVLATMVCGD
jgi:hypothetical protein